MISPAFKTLFLESPAYPSNLKQIPNPPAKIFLQGNFLKQDARAVAIIGSRIPTEYGKKIALQFSSYLAKKGLTIVSGLARGIDTVSHKAALLAGGRTVAVLGSGIDWIYPPENKFLAGEIARHGAVITEFTPGTPPIGKNFLSRNRIISGLSLAVLVIEGARRSGTLSISNWALDQGRDVFAIPGRIDSRVSELPNYLIENGATPVTKPEDLLDRLG